MAPSETKRQNQLDRLIAKKEQYFSRVQKLYDLGQNIENEVNVKNFSIRFKSLEDTKMSFSTVVDEINEIKLELDEAYIPDYKALDAFDELYCNILCVAEKVFAKSKKELSRTSESSGTPKNIPRLPQIELPGFSGNPRDWPTFYECFRNLIHDNKDLNDIDRVHYLIGKLSGKALAVCSGVPPVADNYKIIWQALVDKYQDNRLLANTYLEQLFELKPAQTASANNLNNFLEKFDTATRALKQLKIEDLFDYTLVYLALKKLDPESNRLFENSRGDTAIPSYQEVLEFVKEQTKIYTRTCTFNKPVLNTSNNSKSKLTHSFVVNSNSNQTNKCPMCNATHLIVNCSKFLEMSPNERYTIVRNKNLCLNCLGFHRIIGCKSKMNCRFCHYRHHSLLHFGKSAGDNSSGAPQMSDPVDSGDIPSSSGIRMNPNHSHSQAAATCNFNKSDNFSTTQNHVSLCSTAIRPTFNFNKTVLLSTAIVNILGQNGEIHRARFLLDSASQSHFITIKCCRRLKLPMTKLHSIATVRGIGVASCSTRGLVDIVISSCFNPIKRYPLEALVVDNIVEKLPFSVVQTDSLSYIRNLPLADSTFHIPGEIDGIIGADLYPYLLGQTRIFGPPNLPVAIETSLGFVLMGTVPVTSNIERQQNFCTILEPPLENLVSKFWEMEELPLQSVQKPEDVECENIFKATYKRELSGRYSVALPFKISPSNLGDSYSVAFRRFMSLEKKLQFSTDYRNQYCDVINDYIEQGHLSKISEENLVAPSYYMPHHGVLKINSTSTPLRVVFDASAKTDSLFSLNDLLHTGPKLQADVLTMFINFRLYEIAFMADIRQMYRQINLSQEHRRFQRILWRFSPSEPISTYELNTVSFGVKSSPFLALRTVRQLAMDEITSYPLASKVICRDMYMDDLISSSQSINEAKLLYNQLIDLFKSGGFDLVKWAVNSKELLEEIPIENRAVDVVNFETDYLKVLGIQWQPKLDIFFFKINPEMRECTKRNILSVVARCFDPLGLIAPVVLVVKLLIKQLWTFRLDWDEIPPDSFVKHWQDFQRDLSLLSEFKIPRHLGIFENSRIMLIGFADACETSFGSVVYLRTVTRDIVQINLICAKTKVSPVKTVSIPRLELCAAHLLSKLIHFVVETFKSRLEIDKIFAFSDSTVVLSWINSSPHRWKTFVANRVSMIQDLVPSNCWFHIDGKDNISDCLSRGLTPSSFMANKEWTTGPGWLRLDESHWPIRSFNAEQHTPLEQKLVTLVATNNVVHPLVFLVERCSSWLKLLRCTVYVLRFVKRIPRRNYISASDLEEAECLLIKTVQNVHFAREIYLIQNKEILTSSLRKLRPFLKNGILRVGGRLTNSYLDFESQHPILLPKKDPLVDLLIDHYHYQNLHTGPNLVLALLRQRFWIVAARGVVRNRIHKCNTCFKVRPQPQFPLMGNLPPCRVQQAKAFLHTGVDYAGPVYIVLNHKRGARSQKAYICLFVCLTTKALHLELVSDLSTDNFLQAFKRFLSRRGLCSVMYSDCGTNFIGAKTKLDEIYHLIESKEFVDTISTELGNRGIQWKFNPPATPHFGSLWESNVKSVKTHLYKVIGNQLLSYEEMHTLLTQIEALLNSRPLCILSSDPSEPLALTPAHFLTLTPLTRLPSADLTLEKLNRLDRYQMIDRMVQDYWKRWHLEYLNTLQVRERWNSPSKPIEIGTIVLLQQANTPPLQWPLGLIVEIFPGRDGVVRVVSVKTKNGIFKRPVIKVCPLPTQ